MPTTTKAKIIWLNNDGILDMPDSKDLLAKSPATPAAKEEDKNHIPIICPLYLFGAYLAVADNPTGLKQSSPNV